MIVGTPRIVKIRLNKDVGLPFAGWCSQARVPAILHTSKEARDEALKVYKKFFPIFQNGKVKNKAGVYFNPCIDTLYLDRASYETSRGRWSPDPEAMAQVQHLAIQTLMWQKHHDSHYEFHNSGNLNVSALEKYSNLKTLTLVRDFTTVDEHKRHLHTTPVHLRQAITNERKMLENYKKKLDEMAEVESKKIAIYREFVHEHMMSPGTIAMPNIPEPKFTSMPAVRVMEYEADGAVYKNGMKGYDYQGKWTGYERGKFVRLGRGWQWVVPTQWAEEEELAKERAMALEVADQWR